MKISTDLANTIVAPKSYAHWEQSHAAFTELRKNSPLAVAEPTGYSPFWVASKFDDIQAIERQNDLFHNGDRAATLTSIAGDEMVRKLTGGSPHLVRSLVQMDNPDHRKYRMLTQAWFLPQNLRKLEDRIREIAVKFVDRMLAMDGKCDFALDVAFLYPLQVVMEVIGVPPEDEPKMLKLTQELFGSTDEDVSRSGKDADETDIANMVNEVIGDFFSYFTAMTADRRANPREDLASIIANGEIDGKPLGEIEALSYYVIAATAGHDTTSATTASAFWALAENPDQFQKLKGDMSLLPGLIEESIRWETPVKHFMRTATADTELSGQKIAQGDWLMLAYPSGNRDEDKFDKPFEFDIERTPNKHVALGYGAHVCLGQHLARMEMRILWEELLPRLKSFELDGTPTRVASSFVSGPKSLPVRFTPA